jgi:drug/metabolite transporter (DMT)-like permease
MPMPISALRLGLLTALVMLAFAGNSVLNRLAVGQGLIGPLSFALWRVLAGAAVLWLMVLLRWRSQGRAIWPQDSARLPAVLGLLAYLIGFSLAYEKMPAGAGALTLFGVVQITMFCGAVLGGETIPIRRWIGAAAAFGGLVVLLVPSSSAIAGAAAGAANDLGAALAMALAGVGWGVYSLVGRRQTDALGATAANFLLTLPIVLAITLWVPEPAPMTPCGLALALVAGALTSGLGYALWYHILPRLGATRAAVAQLTVPLIAAGGGLLIGESAGWRFAAASAMVIAGVVIAMRSGPSRP